MPDTPPSALPLTPLMVPKWDGNHLWLQWGDLCPAGYAVQIQLMRPPANQWSEWRDIQRPWPIHRSWMKIPLLRQGWQVRVQVGRFVDHKTPPLWERAIVASFARPSASFHFENEIRKVTFSAGQIFTALVDGLPASFALGEDLTLEPGAQAEVTMEAMQLSPFNHLDAPGDFRCRPEQGLTIINSTATGNNIDLLGGQEGTMAVLPNPGGPVVITLGKVNR